MSLLRALGRNEHSVQSVSVLLGTTSPQSEYTKKKYRGTSQVYAEDLRLFHTVSTKQTRLTKLSGMSLQGCRPQNLSRNSGTREHDMTVKTSTESQMHVTRRPVCSHWWSAVFVVINGNLITFFFFFYRKIQVIVSSEVRLPAGEHLKLPSFQRAARIHTLHSIPIA